MQLPFFFAADFEPSQAQLIMDEPSSRHIVQVLRLQTGEKIHITNGKGTLAIAEIGDCNKKKAQVNIISNIFIEKSTPEVCMAISTLKTANRFEWFLEKATEIGINKIVPLNCHRTIRQKIRHERLMAICISALIQSRQCWLPEITPHYDFNNWVTTDFEGQKFIAHCEDDGKKNSLTEVLQPGVNRQILIGPEGDFSPEEIGIALNNNFMPVSLGNTRLRTETAGVVAATLLKIK